MKKSTIITIGAFVLGVFVLTAGFILVTNNSISNKLFSTASTSSSTSGTTTQPPRQTYDPMDFTDAEMSQYITLGNYKDSTFELEMKEADYKKYEEHINKEENLKMLLIGQELFDKLTTGVVEEEAIFSFDYSGKLDGVAFKGGTNTNTLAYIKGDTLHIYGGSTFIPGFAEQMLGAEIGKEFDIDIKFPDNYGNADLAGKDTVFTIKINYVIDEIDFNDEWINRVSEGKYATTQDYIDFCINFLIEYHNSDFILSSIMDAATVVSIPQAEFDYYYYDIKYRIEDTAKQYGMTYESFLSSGYAAMFQIVDAKSDEEVREYVENIVKTELVLYAVAEAENIEVTNEEFEKEIQYMIDQYGVTREEIFEVYTDADLRKDILLNKTLEFINDNNVLSVKIIPDSTTSS